MKESLITIRSLLEKKRQLTNPATERMGKLLRCLKAGNNHGNILPVVNERPTVNVSLLSKQTLSSPATSLPSGVSGKNATLPVPEYCIPTNLKI